MYITKHILICNRLANIKGLADKILKASSHTPPSCVQKTQSRDPEAASPPRVFKCKVEICRPRLYSCLDTVLFAQLQSKWTAYQQQITCIDPIHDDHSLSGFSFDQEVFCRLVFLCAELRTGVAGLELDCSRAAPRTDRADDVTLLFGFLWPAC